MAAKRVCAPVEGRDKNILEQHENDIIKLMNPDDVAMRLVQKCVLNFNDRKQIMQPRRHMDRSQALFGMLLTRGSDAYKNFVNVLKESGSDNHIQLAKILLDDDPSPRPLPVEGKLQDVRHKRLSAKIDNHEGRLHALEDGTVRSELEELREELHQKNLNLEHLRQSLETRDGELADARAEIQALRERIVDLEKGMKTLKSDLKEEKDRRAQLESRMDTKDKEMDDFRQSLKDLQTKLSDADTAPKTSSSSVSPKTTLATGGTKHRAKSGKLPTVSSTTPKNRFQSEEDNKTFKRNPPLPHIKPSGQRR